MIGSLESAVRRAVGTSVRAVQGIHREPIAYDAFVAARSVVRVRGVAVTANGTVPWSMIEKVTEGPAVASPYLYDNGLREFRAYQSGLLADLAPGLSAPAAHGLDKTGDGHLTLWLEDAGDRTDALAPAEVLAAARRLGRLSGGWIGRIPDHPWLFTGWIDRHSQPEAMERDLARLRSLRAASTIEERVGWRIANAIELIEMQPMLRSALERLPQTLCHHDAVLANVFRGRTDDETLLIDWEMVGPGPIGADLVSLLFSSVRRGDASVAALPGLMPLALEAYADGVRDMGAAVDSGELRIGLNAAIGLRWSLARDVVVALDEGRPVFRGSAPEESPADALDELIELSSLLFASAAEARRMIS